jgi:uncharacterized protein YndB with AHSA1/START domain
MTIFAIFRKEATMSDTPTPQSTATGEGISITRVFDAPRALVFQAWTDPAQFAQWFGGREAEVPLSRVKMDVRPGGEWSLTMIAGPDRSELPFGGHYREVVEPERLVFTVTDSGDLSTPEVEVVTVTLADLGDKTEASFHQGGGHLSEEEYQRAKAGWEIFFDALADHLAKA